MPIHAGFRIEEMAIYHASGAVSATPAEPDAGLIHFLNLGCPCPFDNL